MSRIAAALVVLTVIFAAPAVAHSAVTVTVPARTVTTGATAQGATAPGATAQGTTSADTVTTGTGNTGTTTAAAGAGSKLSTESNGKSERGVAIVILGLGAVALLLAYFFYNGWRVSYEKLAASALRITDRFPRTEFNPVENAVFRARGLTADEAQSQPVVEGPAGVAVGDSADFKATVDGAAAVSCAWAVEPAGSATVQPATGAETKLTALKEGAITLTATVGAGMPTLVHLTVLSKASEGGVPLLGVGFAGVAATIIAFAIAGALTALNIISGSAFIAFLGPVVGYFFATSRNSGQGGGSTGGSG
jgi:hypothetical protein